MLYLQAVILQEKKDNFNTRAIFILIEQIGYVDIDKDENKERLKVRENFWILKLETLTPKALIKKLINIFESIILFT